MKIVDVNFNNYFLKEYKKYQIYLHHTVSPNRSVINRNGTSSDIRWWRQQNNYVNTPYIIDSDGIIYKLYNDKYWAYHLGTKDQTLNKHSIGIELDNLGPLIYTKKGFTSYAYPNQYYIKSNNVLDFGTNGYRGHRFYEAYSQQQIDSLKLLLLDLCDRYGIPKHYNNTMFELSQEALNHVPGIWSHTSVRIDKSDVCPDPKLITMLKELKPQPIIQIPIPKKPIVFIKEEPLSALELGIKNYKKWNLKK